MKVSLSWLKDYVDVKIRVDELAEKLTMAGLEVSSIYKFGREVIFDIEVTPNRTDCLSIIGIAREVAAITKRKLKLPKAVIRSPRAIQAVRNKISKGFNRTTKDVKIEVKEEASDEFTYAKGLLGKEITIPEWIEIDTSTPDIYFYPDGSIGGKDIEISGYQNKATIYIKESIGRIDLQKNYE